MTEYLVKVGFWLRAFDSVTIEAQDDAEAVDKSKVAAVQLMEATGFPDWIDQDERRAGIIAYVDRLDPQGRHTIVEDVEFDDERVDGATCPSCAGPPTA